MARWVYIFAICGFMLGSKGFGLTVGVNESGSPFNLEYIQGENSSVQALLQVINGTADQAVVLSWQLTLELRPLPGATGSLLFVGGSAPPNSLFGPSPGPYVDPPTPSPSVLAFDGDTNEFTGEEIAASETRNILELTLTATADSAGTFQLVMPEFDPGNPEMGSSWFAADGSEPIGFANSSPSAFANFILLGTISVMQTSIPGDYDGDRNISAADYSHWVTAFGNDTAVGGTGADGNGDSRVDAADYVLWRKLHDANTIAGEARRVSPVPEPACLVISLLTIGGCNTRAGKSRGKRSLYI